MPFAGHPNVGTGWVPGLGRDQDGVLRFEEIAGLVEVRIDHTNGRQVTIAAPQPLSLGAEMPVDLLAGCVGLDASDVVVAAHRPIVASVGNFFVIAEVAGSALSRAAPDIARFRAAVEAFPALGPRRLPLYLYAHDGRSAGTIRLRARMFSPLSGTLEDAATGSAATPLAALLLSLAKGSEQRYDITQGVEIGRPSLLACSARRGGDASGPPCGLRRGAERRDIAIDG
jgi:trans-2,3-dihydro-3-hydroxyanthranilate isomerase